MMYSKIRHGVSRIVVVLLSLFPAIGYGVPDQCDHTKTPALESNNSSVRVSANRACLNVLAVPLATEINNAYGQTRSRLFTYGHPDKIAMLLSKDKDYIWEFTIGLQSRKEERMAFRLGSIKDYGTPGVIAAARNLDNIYYDLDDLFTAFVTKVAPSESDKATFNIAAFAKVYPNFIDHIGGNRATDAGKSPARLKGEKLGASIAPGFDSTGGFGIYLSLTPVSSLEHIQAGGSGVVCDPPIGNVFVNLDNASVKAALVAAGIYIPEHLGDQLILRPSGGKNLFVSPQDFEKAAKGFLIGFKPSHLSIIPNSLPYVVDKHAVAFKNKCQAIDIEAFSDCRDFKDLIGSGFYSGQNPKVLDHAFFDLLKGRPKFDKKLFKIWNACAKYNPGLICNDLINGDLKAKNVQDIPHMKRLLFTDQKTKYKKMLKICGIP